MRFRVAEGNLILLLCGYFIPAIASAQLPSTIDLSLASSPAFSHLLRIAPESSDQKFGSDLSNGIAFGDFNGDGYDDMAIGSPEYNHPGRVFCGSATIVFGNAELSGKNLNLQSPSPSVATITTFIGAEMNDVFGAAVAFGDFNADGFDDLAVGAPLASPNGRSEAGVVYVFRGGTSLVGTTIDLATTTPASTLRLLGSAGADVINETGEVTDYQMGSSLATCDFNGDSVSDLIIGAPLADPEGREDAGETILYYGSTSLPSGNVDLGAAAGTHGETRLLGDDPGDFLGFAGTAGDFNGDGLEDLATSAPDGTIGSGRAYILFGSTSRAGQTINLNLSAGRQLTAQFVGGESEDTLGFSLAAGNLNSDAFDDLVLSARLASPQAVDRAGSVYIFYGNDLAVNQTYQLSTAPGTYNETRIHGSDAEDLTGHSTAVSDINGDGVDDIILGLPGGDPGGRSAAGEVYLIYGVASGKIGVPAGNGSLLSLAPDKNGVDVAVLGDNTQDRFGYGGEAGGDLDRNGFAEFAASAFTDDHEDPELDNAVEYAATVFGSGSAGVAQRRIRLQNGAIMRKPVGGRLSPVMRTWLSFDGGTGSSVIVTLTRNKTAISNLSNDNPDLIAPLYWRVQVNRTGYTAAQVHFQYLDSEITGLTESRLKLFQAPALSGPWTTPPQTLDANKNTIQANVNSFAYFAIKAEGQASVSNWMAYR